MIIKDTRTNEKGEEEIVISDFSDFKELVDEIHKIRKHERKYNKVIVRKDVRIENDTIDYYISFSNVVFEKDIILEKINFKKPLSIIDSIFTKKISFNHSNFSEKAAAIFTNTTFKGKVGFRNINFENIVDFSMTKFTGENFNHSDDFEIIGISTRKILKKENISFTFTKFNSTVDFYSAIFKIPQCFYLIHFMDNVNFNDVTFEQEIQFLECKLTSNSYINFKGTMFNKGLDISRSNFIFGKTSFWNINVKEEGLLGDTLSSKYYKNDFGYNKILPSVPKKLRESIRFIKNSFYSEGNRIEGSNFEKKELEVYREELYTKMRGTGAEKKKSTLILSKEEVASTFGMYIPLIIYLNNNENKNLYWVFIVLSIFFLLFLIITKSTIGFKEGIKNIKEIIKSNLIVYSISIFVFISTLFFYLYGLYLYPQDNNPIIWYILNFAFLSPIFIFFNLTKDYIILLFNKYSNDFGTNWVNGVVFTLLISMITFVLMATFSDLTFAWHERGVNNVLEGILEIINLFPFKETNEESLFYNMNTGTKIVLFIGRIFIGYGVYQTIQAFRKYGKS